MTQNALYAENARRNAIIAERLSNYNPLTGLGAAGMRLPITINGKIHHLPVGLLTHPDFDPTHHHTLRQRYDFEYWCATSYQVKDPRGYGYTNLIPTYPQRQVIKALTAKYSKSKDTQLETHNFETPRLIALHDAHLGISTISAAYIYWLKFIVTPFANAIVYCQSGAEERQRLQFPAIRYLLRNDFPHGRFDDLRYRNSPTFIRNIDSYIYYYSSQNPHAARGMTFNYVLLSNAANWDGLYTHKLMRSYRATVSALHFTGSLLIIESNASSRHRNNPFYQLWQKTLAGTTNLHPLYLAWYHNENNHQPLNTPIKEFWDTLTPEEHTLWHRHNCTLEQINYHRNHITKKDTVQNKHLKHLPLTQRQSVPNAPTPHITTTTVGENPLTPTPQQNTHLKTTPHNPHQAIKQLKITLFLLTNLLTTHTATHTQPQTTHSPNSKIHHPPRSPGPK